MGESCSSGAPELLIFLALRVLTPGPQKSIKIAQPPQMSYSLNSLKGGIILGTTIGVIQADNRSLDCSSNVVKQANLDFQPIPRP